MVVKAAPKIEGADSLGIDLPWLFYIDLAKGSPMIDLVVVTSDKNILA